MAIEMKIPTPGESITEVSISTWLKSDGDYVFKDEVLCEIESDKATLTLAAEANGLLKILVQAGENIGVGSVACTIDTSAAPPANGTPKKAAVLKPESEIAANVVSTHAGGTYATGTPSVAAKKMLDESNLKSADVKGTGKDGRITKGDVLTTLEKSTVTNNDNGKQSTIPAAIAGARSTSRVKMSKLRQKISERLVGVKNQTAMLTTFNEVDMKALMELRSKYKDSFKEKYGVGLGFMSLFTKACCIALKEVPAVNAKIDNDELVYHNYVDIGVAVSTPKGLMVPVVRNAETLSLAEIELAIKTLAVKARDGKISVDEMTGGTFTITNGGVFGSMLSTPIINPPQSGILGMHNIVERPVAIKGEVKIHPIMYLALSYDHRIIDGKESVTFLYRVKEVLEDPARMLLEI